MVSEAISLMVGAGIVATIVSDLVSKFVFGKSHWNLVGRWVAGIPHGKLINTEISESPSVSFEVVLGWGLDCPHDRRQILSSRRGLFKGLRTDAAEVTVAPGPVVEHFNVIEDIRPG